MSRENIETIHAMAAALSRGDVEGLVELFDPDIEWIPNPDFPIGANERWHGHEGLRNWHREWFVEPWEHVDVDIDEVIDAGNNRYVYVAHIQGRGRASGIEVDMRIYDVMTFRDGRAIRRMSFMDKQRALEAARLPE